MKTIVNKIIRIVFFILVFTGLFSMLTREAFAVRLNDLSDLNKARVSFTFDDGFASTRTLAAPILEARGIDGVLYLSSGVPNGTLILDDNQPGITWDQVRELQNVYGWEIGAHSENHGELPTLSQEALRADLANSHNAFRTNGLNVTNFASPFGAYENYTLVEILKYNKSQRGFADRDALNTYPYNNAVLMVQSVEEGVTNAQVQAWIDQAIAQKCWLILVYHDIAPQHNPDYVYTNTTAELTAHATYVQQKVAAKQIEAVTIEEGITIPGVDIVQNGGFEAGLTQGWNTDNAASVKADANNNGNYGSPQYSVNLTGTAAPAHLFSGSHTINYNTSYMLHTFYNALALSNGELGFYLDEYDASGEWISGQWLGNVTNGTIGFFSKLYNATSTLVQTMKIQIYLTAGATGNAFVDSVKLYDLDNNPAPTPTVTPTITPTMMPTPTPVDGFTAQYFNNMTLSGTPVLTRTEQSISYDWGGSSPTASISADQFSARWTKTTQLQAGTYSFTVTGDDGVRVLVDGEVIIDKFINQAPTTYSATKTLTAGSHTIVVEYFENIGGAVAKFNYALLPQAPAPANVYSVEYFSNTEFAGTPVITRTESVINNDWGSASPAAALPVDNFSARWVRTVAFTQGTYAFTATADDGIRVLLDGVEIINGYKNQPPTTYTVQRTVSAGNHTIVVEYYEAGGGAVAKFDFAPVDTTPMPVPDNAYAVKFWNISPEGTPTVPVTAPVVTRTDSEINNDWKMGAPAVGVNADGFIAQWVKRQTFDAGTYKFTTVSDDGIRVYIDNVLVLDQWNDHATTTHTVTKELTAGQHDIRVEYYEKYWDAVARFTFEKVTVSTQPPVPADTFTAEFFANPDLFGTPAITRQDTTIAYLLSNRSLSPELPVDNFSARWTKTKQYAAGTYTYTVRSDDGVRLFIDDQVVINDWTGHAATTYTVTIPLSAGLHTIKLEYFEAYGEAEITFQEQ